MITSVRKLLVTVAVSGLALGVMAAAVRRG